jgi:hypothetical protein
MWADHHADQAETAKKTLTAAMKPWNSPFRCIIPTPSPSELQTFRRIIYLWLHRFMSRILRLRKDGQLSRDNIDAGVASFGR